MSKLIDEEESTKARIFLMMLCMLQTDNIPLMYRLFFLPLVEGSCFKEGSVDVVQEGFWTSSVNLEVHGVFSEPIYLYLHI